VATRPATSSNAIRISNRRSVCMPNAEQLREETR